MSVQSRITLKSYFMAGARLDESDFADLIDSSLLVEDLVTALDNQSTVLPLSASAGSELNTKITDLITRVTDLEDGENTFAEGYYNKTEVDTLLEGVDNYINALTFGSQIDTLDGQVADILNQLTGKADAIHDQPISSVTGLQEALDQKATIDELNNVRDSLMVSINAFEPSDESAQVASLQDAVNQINTTISTLATKDELSILVGPDHDHLIDDLDLSGYYTKSEVDVIVSNLDYPSHVHMASSIEGLGAEIQDKAALLLQDHTALTNNPHNVTKEQIGLDKVENMTPTEIVESAGGLTSTLVDDLENKVDAHIAGGNPHNINKAHVGLENVPNVNVQALLEQHIGEENPHNVDISVYDIYTTSQADQRIQDYITATRYEFTPLTNDDSAGEVGDFAYDSENLYFKARPTEWVKIPFGPVYVEEIVEVEQTNTVSEEDISSGTPVQQEATQEDVDAGLATSVGETIIIVKETVIVERVATQTEIDNGTATEEVATQEQIDGGNTTERVSTQAEIDDGTATQTTATQEQVDAGLATSVGETIYVTNVVYVVQEPTEQERLATPEETTGNVAEETVATQEDVDEGRATSVGETIVIIKEVVQEVVQTSEVTIQEVSNIQVTEEFALSDAEGTPLFQISDENNILQAPTTIDNLSIKQDEIATETPLTIDAPQVNITNTYIDGGSITNVTNVTTTEFSSATAVVTDLNTSDITSARIKTRAFTLFQSSEGLAQVYSEAGIRYDWGERRLKVDDGNGEQTFAYTTDQPDLSPYALKSDIPSNIGPGKGDGSDGANITDTVIDATTGGLASGYAFSEGAGLYADDPNIAGDQEYWTYETEGIDTTGFVINIGVGANNPSLKYNYQDSNWEFFDGNISVPVRNGASLTEEVIDAKIAAVVDSAPGTLNTLNELAAALGDDANYATTTANSLSNRVRVDTNNQGLSLTQKQNARTNISASAEGHNHDSRYYTQATSNGRYYTKTEVQGLINSLRDEITSNLYAY